MVVFRGGGYRINNGSGVGCAEFFAERGLLGVEAEYRTVEGPGASAAGGEGPLFPKPLQDAARAVRLLRHRAVEFGIDPNRIGVAGFSAGGHLATMLCREELPCQEAVEDDLVHVSFRPDVCILSYPVISMLLELRGTKNLSESAENLGCAVGDEELLSAELRVSRGHPPTFLWHTKEDDIVPSAHAEGYACALGEKGVPHKLLLYDAGPHALGMALDGDHANDWASQMWAWLGDWAAPRFSVPAPSLD